MHRKSVRLLIADSQHYSAERRIATLEKKQRPNRGAGIYIVRVDVDGQPLNRSMTIAKLALLTELNYTAWANQLLLDACATLSAEELSRNLGTSHKSIIRTLRHIYDGERSWIQNLVTNSIPSIADMEAAGAADQARPEPTLDALKQSWPQVWADAHQWIEPLEEEELAIELSSRERDGRDVRVARWNVLLHMVNHSTLHRGQIIGMFRLLGKRPPNLDLFTYYRRDSARLR